MTATIMYSQNNKANQHLLKAREYFKKGDPCTGGTLAQAREAIRLYEQAVKTDPKFALAFVELSRAWDLLGYSEPDGITNKELLPHAKAAATHRVLRERKPFGCNLKLRDFTSSGVKQEVDAF